MNLLHHLLSNPAPHETDGKMQFKEIKERAPQPQPDLDLDPVPPPPTPPLTGGSKGNRKREGIRFEPATSVPSLSYSGHLSTLCTPPALTDRTSLLLSPGVLARRLVQGLRPESDQIAVLEER